MVIVVQYFKAAFSLRAVRTKQKLLPTIADQKKQRQLSNEFI